MSSLKTKIAAFVAYITPLRIIILLASTYLIFMLTYFILAGLSNGLNMDTYAADGTFQLYNPMRRLLAGEIIGKDFPFFHGVGVPLLHFPAFYLLGHNVFAADAAKWLMSPLVFLIATFLFFLAFFRKVSHSLIATATLTILALICIDVVWPGNSLLGIRTTFPTIVAAFMLWQPRWNLRIGRRSLRLYHPIISLLLAFSVACGTEQGLAATIAYLVIETVRAIRSTLPLHKWWWRVTLKTLGSAVVTYIVISILTLGHANDALHYALIDVPKDQGWYFGAPPNDFLAWNTFNYIFDPRVLTYLAPIIVLGIISLFVAIWRKLLSRTEICAFGFLLIYGIVVFGASVMGYWAPSAQLVPLTRVLGLTLVAITLRVGLHYVAKQKSGVSSVHRLSLIVYILLFIAFGWYIFLAYRQVNSFPVRQILTQVKDARHAPDGTYVSSYWKKRISAFAPYIPSGATIWSTYTSVYDSMKEQLNGSSQGEDYIIHALGKQRREQYTKDFISQKPDFVITLKPSYFQYEEWLWDRHWPFYEQLVTHYKIIADNDSHILWQRQSVNQVIADSQALTLKPTPDGLYQITPGVSDHIRLYEVTVNYAVKKPIPLADKVSRYLMTITGSSVQRFSAALPPYETNWQFPVILAPGDTTATITPSTQGLGFKSHLDISSLTYKEVALSSTNGYVYYDSYCSFGGTLTYPAMGSQYHHLRCTQDQLNLKFFESQPATNVFLNR